MKAFKQLNNRKKLSSRVAPFKHRSAAEKAVSLSGIQSTDQVVNSTLRASQGALNTQFKLTLVRG